MIESHNQDLLNGQTNQSQEEADRSSNKGSDQSRGESNNHSSSADNQDPLNGQANQSRGESDQSSNEGSDQRTGGEHNESQGESNNHSLSADNQDLLNGQANQRREESVSNRGREHRQENSVVQRGNRVLLQDGSQQSVAGNQSREEILMSGDESADTPTERQRTEVQPQKQSLSNKQLVTRAMVCAFNNAIKDKNLEDKDTFQAAQTNFVSNFKAALKNMKVTQATLEELDKEIKNCFINLYRIHKNKGAVLGRSDIAEREWIQAIQDFVVMVFEIILVIPGIMRAFGSHAMVPVSSSKQSAFDQANSFAALVESAQPAAGSGVTR